MLEEGSASTAAGKRGVVLIDARNVYESRIGRFEVAGVPTLLPQTRQFSELPAFIDAHLEELRGKKVLMYCTGGVRCESASAYVRHALTASSSASFGASSDVTEPTNAESEGAERPLPAAEDAEAEEAEAEVVQLAGGIERYMAAYPEGGFFRGKNLVFDRRLRTAPPAAPIDDVIGTCHDLHSLLYSFLDEWLYQFNGELFVSRRVKIRELDRETFRISSAGVGETFQLGRHPQGIEVKGITYSAMSITEAEGRVDILVIVDV